MKDFKKIFGIPKQDIKETCVIAPFLTKYMQEGLGVKKMEKGALYACANNESSTIIRTGMGSGFAGDAVLYLSDTACKQIFLFGSCGSVDTQNGLKAGDIIAVKKAYSQEGFTAVLKDRDILDILYPNSELLNNVSRSTKLRTVNCISIGSLKLEREYIKNHTEDIEVIDMETSAVYSASQYIGIKCVSILFITDILNDIPYYDPDVKRTQETGRKAAVIIYDLLKTI